MRLMGWLPFLSEIALPRLTGEMLAEIVHRQGATAGSLDDWGWRKFKVLPVSWFDEFARILTRISSFFYVLGHTRVLRSIHVLLSPVEVAAPVVDNTAVACIDWFLLVFYAPSAVFLTIFGMLACRHAGREVPSLSWLGELCSVSCFGCVDSPSLWELGTPTVFPRALRILQPVVRCLSFASEEVPVSDTGGVPESRRVSPR